MSALPSHVHEALLAIQTYVEYSVQTAADNSSDTGYLWEVADQLALSLAAALERLAVVEPEAGPVILEAITGADNYTVECASSQPDILAHLVRTQFSPARIARLSPDRLADLLASHDPGVRLSAITAMCDSPDRRAEEAPGRQPRTAR